MRPYYIAPVGGTGIDAFIVIRDVIKDTPRSASLRPASRPPTGAGWVHEITRHGYDWAKKYPRVVEAARKPKAKSFLIDGEVVWCGADEASC